jgi:hypothetical protein
MNLEPYPLVFSAEMALAAMRGHKTQTRRIINPQPEPRPSEYHPDLYHWEGKPAAGFSSESCMRDMLPGHWTINPGRRLYVREPLERGERDGTPEGVILYTADGEPAWDVTQPCVWPWKPRKLAGRYCPKALARTFLEAVSVRVERVQDITPADARAEGLTCWSKDGNLFKWGIGRLHRGSGELDATVPWQDLERTPVGAFHQGWNTINGHRAGGTWEDNPFVWCLQFKRVDK